MTEFEKLLDEYRDAMEACLDNELHNRDGLPDEQIEMSEYHVRELRTRQAVLDAYAALEKQLDDSFPKSQVHTHVCGTCGQIRECHHLPCYFNGLADCDPDMGHRSVTWGTGRLYRDAAKGKPTVDGLVETQTADDHWCSQCELNAAKQKESE